MIELAKLNKCYANIPALNNVDLFVQEGEIFGIIGKSGAGKSTLLRCINLLEKPDSGDVIINNNVITQLSSSKLNQARHKMGMIFQDFNLLGSKTVDENIALPMQIQGIAPAFIKEKINELLKLVELEEKIYFYPNQLSGGQKQRVAIARALSCDPKILLCDEATSALDPHTTDAILDLLKKINQFYGITIVLITHEMDVIKRICHRLALMEQGKIIEISALSTIFDNDISPIREILYKNLSPKLPACLNKALSSQENNSPLLRLFFQGHAATVPFISQASRELNLDVNILLANIDHFDTITCGIVIVELSAEKALLNQFIKRCEEANLKVEILGYVTDNVL